ncbi:MULTISPECIES: hypothetical protein [unclassified Chelatococcus]|uniref:hypothetical protein n=1 Tax=unclassified Chelatococcus TaxID=2638111 RepID=UPI001BCAEBAF|nr:MULTISPECIES: hypothetical protein [unclassified Chelatococcus]MBS7698363.1 hypothetical protein [Chelatococcus sp. YT9]MBX3558870.1 hypothetical protein [Chelatococcus sp.]
MANYASDPAGAFFDDFGKVIVYVPKKLGQGAIWVGDQAYGGISSAASTVRDAVGSAATKVGDSISAQWDDARWETTRVWDGVKELSANLWDSVSLAGSHVLNEIRTGGSVPTYSFADNSSETTTHPQPDDDGVVHLISPLGEPVEILPPIEPPLVAGLGIVHEAFWRGSGAAPEALPADDLAADAPPIDLSLLGVLASASEAGLMLS